ncbi:TPA: hypothetical protein N0F65_000260 [Lagenidium giganteum]|uniref:NUDE domain-containing protein n=1 Tax=Lagenidium giganteum TaxID=4803 RepID=A0AAV2Z9T8_9STRA|nr:TPA: hypothetical protein N0F65_000260 [Lagenidium giganteum]
MAPEDSQLDALRAAALKKQQELEHVQAEFDEYRESSQELEQELEQELARAEAATAQLKQRVALRERELDSARASIKALTEKLNAAHNQLIAAQRAEVELRTRNRQLEQEHDDLSTRVRVLEATERDLTHKLEREMEERVFVSVEHEELKRVHAVTTERLRSEVLDLQSEVEAFKSQARKNNSLSASAVQSPTTNVIVQEERGQPKPGFDGDDSDNVPSTCGDAPTSTEASEDQQRTRKRQRMTSS